MNTQELLGHLEKSGIELWLDGDQLQVRGPQAGFSLSMLDDLKRHKEQIIEHLGRRGAKNAAALASPQSSLLSIYQADAANVAYNVASAFRLRVPAEPDALNRAFVALQHRHDTLRTTIHHDASGAMTILHEHPLAELEVEQASNEDEQAILERLIDRRFDLGRGPVCRLVLVRRGGEELLILLCHHIAADFWSMEVLTDELARLYEAACDGKTVDWPIVAKSYRDFAREEGEYLASAGAQEDRRYWSSALSGDLPVLAIASAGGETKNDRAMTGTTSFEPWEGGRFARVAEAARAHDVSPFVYLLSVYYLLLWRYGRATDIVVGVPSTLRTIYGCEQTVGHYVNTLPLRMQIEPKVPFRDWVQSVNRTVLAGMDHQAYPFPEMVRALPRTGARSPVFQAMFNLVRARDGVASAAKRAFGEMIYWTGNGVHGAPCDLMLTVSDSDDAATLAWNCSTPLVDAALAEPLARSFDLLIDQVVRDPAMPLSRLKVWSHAATDPGLELSGPLADSPDPGLLHEAVRAQARRTPTAIAISDGEKQLTYAELDAESDRVAELFLRQGLVGIETIVAVLMSRKADIAVAFLAVLKAGGVVLPLDTRYPLARIATILDGSKAGLLLHDAAYRDIAAQTSARQVAWESLLADARDLVPTAIHGLALTPQRLAWIIYTSGSTGVPNGVALEHRNFLNLFRHSGRLFQPDDLKVVLASSAICFDVSIYELFLPLTVGGKVVIVENALNLPEGLDGVTFINAVASVLDAMLQLERIPPTVKVITSTGEPLMRPLANRVHALSHVRQLYNHYGPAETCIYSMVSAVARDAQGRIAIGRAIEGHIRVLDECGNEVPPGIIGEIYISSGGVSRGYLHGPALTSTKFLPDPYAETPGSRMYRTGDFGRYLPGGEVEYVSRRDSQVKLRGFRIELQEIETALLGQADVKSAAVKVQNSPTGPYLVAYVVTKSGDRIDPADLGRKLAARLPHYMVPQFYLQLAVMPLNPSGKIDRKSLPLHAVGGVTTAAPKSSRLALGDAEVADVIASVWKDILAVPEVDADDDFFRLGGHSLSSATVIARVNQAFGLALTPVALFETPVFSDFVARVSSDTGVRQNIPVPAVDGAAAAGAVSCMQRGMWLDAQLGDASRLASYNVGFAIEMRGETDVERVQQSLRLLVARHAALRTVFRVVDGKLVSQVREEARIDLGVTDSPAKDASKDSRSFLAIPLSPERGPLLAARLLKHGPTHCTLVLKLHHLIADGRTFRILADELKHIHVSGSCAGLPELPVSYQSFAVSLDEWLATGSADQQREFWAQMLADAPRLPQLAGTRLEDTKSFSGDEVSFELSPRVTDALQALARQVGATPYMLYHSAFALLLARLSGQGDLILGTPFSCRHHPSLEGLAGLFVNMLPLRVKVDEQETFLAFLKRQRKSLLRALANGTVPFDSMSRDLRNNKQAQALPLMQCVFSYEHLDQMKHEVAGTTWRWLRIPEHSAKFDLMLQHLETSEGLKGALIFRTGSFAPAAVEQLRDCWLALLESLAAAPDAPLLQLRHVREPTAPLPEEASHRAALEDPVEQDPEAELREIESQLLRHSEIESAAVVAREEQGARQLVAYVVCRNGGLNDAPSIEALRNHLKLALPEHKVPGTYVYLEQLPRMPDGKLDSRALPVVDDSAATQKAYEAPQGKIEEALAGIWQESLHLKRVGRGDSFFELGGHSILAMHIVAEIEKRFEMKLSINTFFESPTIEKLAGVVLASGGLPRDQQHLPELRSDPANRHEPFPLTDIQQTYLVGRSGLYPLGDIATHGYSEADVDDIDMARFERAFDILFSRHEMLRVVITPDQKQRILPTVPPYRVQFRDLAGNDASTAEAALADIRKEMTGQVKTGGEWPLLETRVTKLPDGRYRIHSLIDALISDAFSTQILMRELLQCYDGLEDLLEPIDVSFRDYVLAIEEHKRLQPYLQSKRYWLDRLDTLPGAPELPVSPQRATRANGEFRVREKRYEAAQWKALKRRASTHGLTPSNLLLSAYAAVIATWSKSSRFLLNLTLFNRLPLHPHINRVIGDFTSLTLLEIDCQRQDFHAFAMGVQQQFWRDLEHRHFSGVEVLRERARGTHDVATSVVPVVFTSAIGGEGLIEDAVGSPGSNGQMHVIDGEGVAFAQTSQVWLDHAATEENGALRLNWNSVDALFEPGVLDSMFEAYTGLLDEILRDDRPLRQISTNRMPPAQLAARAAVNRDEQKFADVLLHQLVAEQVAATPAAPALIAGELTLSYAELWAASGVLAERLLQAGVQPQDRVAIVMHKGWEQVVASLAIVRAGAVYVPIDRSLPTARRNLLVSSVGAKVALVQEGDASDLPGATVLVLARDVLTALPGTEVSVTQPSDAVAYVIFTSGSTGTPKGVVIDHAGAVNTILDINRRFGVGAADRTLALSSLSFDLSVYDIFGLLAAGGALVVPDEDELKDPSRWRALIESREITLFNAVPALMQLLVEHVEEHSLALPSCLRLVMMSGDWIPAALPDRIRRLARRDIRVISLGGATEASIWSVFHEVHGETSGLRSIPYGKPLANQSLHVLRQDLSACPDWVAGDLYIGGKGLAKGYWGDAEKTARSFIEPGDGQRLYRTGDKARYMEDGVLEFLGREDTQVKVQGYRIELGEIESRLSMHPGVNQAVACVQKDSRGNARLAAYVVPKVDSQLGVEHKLKLQLGKPAIRSFDTRGVSLALSEAVFVLDARIEAPAKLSAEALGEWLTCVSQFQPQDSVLPRYFYPSAGSLNPVQLYVVVHEALRTEFGVGIEPGSYYYHPVKHALYRVAGSAADVGAGDEAGHPLTTVLVGERNAIEPVYKELADDFCRIEAGYMQGLMASHGAAFGFNHQEGSVEAQAWRTRLGLTESQRVLAAGHWRTDVPVAAGARREISTLSLHGRQSFRRYEGDPVNLAGLESLLRRAIESQHIDAERMPVLVYLKRDAGALHRGFYRVTAQGLVRLGDAQVETHHFAGFNAPIYEVADVVLFALSAQGASRDRDLNSAGRLGQFLMSRAGDTHIGWCPIGSVLFGQVAQALGLPGNWELVHCLTGGAVSDKQLRAFESARSGDGIAQDLPASLQEFLKQQLPAYMVPQQIMVLDAMPLSANGKVARDQLPLASQPVQAVTRQLRPASTATERRLVELWKEILGIADAGIDQTFFELGGNSMLLICMHSRLKSDFATDLAMVDLFNFVDIKSLAARLDDKRQSGNDLASLQHQAEKRRQALGRLRGSSRH